MKRPHTATPRTYQVVAGGNEFSSRPTIYLPQALPNSERARRTLAGGKNPLFLIVRTQPVFDAALDARTQPGYTDAADDLIFANKINGQSTAPQILPLRPFFGSKSKSLPQFERAGFARSRGPRHNRLVVEPEPWQSPALLAYPALFLSARWRGNIRVRM